MSKRKGCKTGIKAFGYCIPKKEKTEAIARVRKIISKQQFREDKDDFKAILSLYKKGEIAKALRWYQKMDTNVRDNFSHAFTKNNSDFNSMLLFAKDFKICWNVTEHNIKNKRLREKLLKIKGLSWQNE
jgi:hypothetical protein